MNVKGELQVLLKDSYDVINELQRVSAMADVKKELARQSHHTLKKIECLKSYLHELVDSFEIRAKSIVDTITCCKIKTLESHSDEVLQCLEYLTKMCVIAEDLVKPQDDSESVLDFAWKLKEELSNGLKGCKELNLIDYDMFVSLDLKLDTSWLFETPFLNIISKSSKSQSESTLCSIGFEDAVDTNNSNSRELQEESKSLETDSSGDSFHDGDGESKFNFYNQKNTLSTIPEGFEEDMSQDFCKLELDCDADDIIKQLDAALAMAPIQSGLPEEENTGTVINPLASSPKDITLQAKINLSGKHVTDSSSKDYSGSSTYVQFTDSSSKDYSGSSTSVQLQGASCDDIEDVHFVSESECEEIDNCDIIKSSAVKPPTEIDMTKQTISSQNGKQVVINKSVVGDHQVQKEPGSIESQITPTTKIIAGKAKVENDSNGAGLHATQITIKSESETSIQKSSQPNDVPRYAEKSVNILPFSVADQGPKYNRKTGSSECPVDRIEEVRCNDQLKVTNESIEPSKISAEIKKDSTGSETQLNYVPKNSMDIDIKNSFGKVATTTFPKGILPQFSCSGPLDMLFNIETAMAWNRHGEAEINAVFVKKITGGLNACFEFPIGCCLMKNGCLVVADTGNHVVKILQDDNLQMMIGGNDGVLFIRPSAVVTDLNDNIYVKDDLCVQIFNSQGKRLRTIGKKIFKHPYGLALTNIPRHGPTLFTLDAKLGSPKLHRYLINEDRLQSCEYTPLVYNESQMSKLRFFSLYNDKILASDLGASTMYLSNLDGQLLSRFGCPGYQYGQFVEPSGVAADAAGNWLVADSKNNRIQVFNNSGRFLAPIKFSQPIRRPSGIHLSSDGTLYVINYLDHCIKMYKLTNL